MKQSVMFHSAAPLDKQRALGLMIKLLTPVADYDKQLVCHVSNWKLTLDTTFICVIIQYVIFYRGLIMADTKFRTRNFMLLLYDDNPSHRDALRKIYTDNYSYASILHNMDEFEEDGENHKKGDLKKAHFHVVLSFPNAKWSTAIQKELEIEHKFIEEVKNLDRALEYLVHLNDTDKYQYDIDEVSGPLATRLADLVLKKTKSEGERIMELIEFIEGYPDYLKVSVFARYCATNGYWSEFRRSGSIFMKILDEHNAPYLVKEGKNDKG